MNNKPSKKGLRASVIGTIVVLLCCFTPILVITVGLVGFGALTPYLDYILFPLLGIMMIVTILAYQKYKKGCESCSTETLEANKQ